MTLLDRLLPDWRNSDAEIRAGAVRQLGKDSQDILVSIARHDDDARVRRAAIKRLDHPEPLLAIGQSDPDEELRALAITRAEELLVEQALSHQQSEECLRALALLSRPSQRISIATRARHASVRRAALAMISDERALAEIARRGDDPEIGLEALHQVTDGALLQRIAISEAPLEVALAALDRIADPDLLGLVAQDPHAHKSVRKRARAVLAPVLSDDHPIRVTERRERHRQLCAAVEALSVESDPAAALAALHAAEQQWQDVGAAADSESEQRFQRACARVLDDCARAERRSDPDRKREAARLQLRNTRQQLCESVETLEGRQTAERLEAARVAWRALGPIEDVASRDLATRFTLAVERCEHRYQRWLVREAFRAQLEELVQQAEELFQSTDLKAAAGQRTVLEQRWAELESSPAGIKWLADERVLQRRFIEAGYALRDRQRSTELQRERSERDARSALTALCTRLEQLVEAESVAPAEAERALRDANEAKSYFDRLPEPTAPLRERVAAARQALVQRAEAEASLDEWKRWANTDLQQQLIERAEALLAAGDARRMLSEVGKIERDWQKFAGPREQSPELWERFRRARHQLRRRGEAYLSDNLVKKEALCAAAERLADSTDWKASAEAIQRMQAEWKEIGAVRQDLSAALFERFRAPANRFFERRKVDLQVRQQRRKETLDQMRSLAESAEGLVESSDWDKAATEIKELRLTAEKLWGTRTRTSAETERQSDVFRLRFRSACDRFFDRYRRRGEIELANKVGEAEAIVAKLESLGASLGVDAELAAADVSQQLEEGFSAWRRMEGLPPAITKAFEQRLQVACDAIDAASPEGLGETELEASNLRQREKLCARVERLVAKLTEGEREPAASDLAQRLKLALAANTIGGRATPPREQELRAAADEIARLEAKWQRLGPLVGRRARDLATRFEQAIASARR